MTAASLARSLIVQARQRFDYLAAPFKDGAFHIVVREAQECSELALKGLLRVHGIEPPHTHELSALLKTHRARLEQSNVQVDPLCDASIALRRDRELSFYGDVDFIPTESYSRAQAESAIAGAKLCVESAESALHG